MGPGAASADPSPGTAADDDGDVTDIIGTETSEEAEAPPESRGPTFVGEGTMAGFLWRGYYGIGPNRLNDNDDVNVSADDNVIRRRDIRFGVGRVEPNRGRSTADNTVLCSTTCVLIMTDSTHRPAAMLLLPRRDQ
jgi:hypothetical protein